MKLVIGIFALALDFVLAVLAVTVTEKLTKKWPEWAQAVVVVLAMFAALLIIGGLMYEL